MTTVVQYLPNSPPPPGVVRQKAYRDDYIDGDNGGVLYIGDMGFPYSYAPGAPTNGKLIRNLAEKGDGSYVLAPKTVVNGVTVDYQPVAHTGGMLDYSATNAAGSYELTPASVTAGLYSGSGYFLYIQTVKLPTADNFNPSTISAPILTASSALNGYIGGPELLMTSMVTQAGSKRILFSRQKALGSVDNISLPPDASHFGNVCLLAFWHNADGQGACIVNVSDTFVYVVGTGPAAAKNTLDPSANPFKIGMPGLFWSSLTLGQLQTANHFGNGRTIFEDLEISGRDPRKMIEFERALSVYLGLYS